MPFDGNIRTGDWVGEVTLTLDTGAYADGDLMANPVELEYASKQNGTSVIQSVTAIDYDDQGGAFHLLFFDSDPGNLGTLNAAMLINDGQAAKLLGHVVVSATDYTDLGGQQVATVTGVSLIVHPANGTSLWVAAKAASASTWAGNTMNIKVGLLRG